MLCWAEDFANIASNLQFWAGKIVILGASNLQKNSEHIWELPGACWIQI
jgi:hypothetical protein